MNETRVHTCHKNCDNPICLLVREIDALKSQLAKVTSQVKYQGHLLNEKDKAIDILHRRVAASQARCGKLQLVLSELVTEIEKEYGESLEHVLSKRSKYVYKNAKEALAGEKDKVE